MSGSTLASEVPSEGRRTLTGIRQSATVRVLKTARVPIEHLVTRGSLVPTDPFLSLDLFPWVPAIESAIDQIEDELLSYQQMGNPTYAIEDISDYQKNITNDGRWRTIWLLGHGHWAGGAGTHFPATSSVLRQIPGLRTAFFSILEPGKALPPHRGPYRGLLRYHLGVIVPTDGECAITVGGEARSWSRGSSLVFDDTYVHSAFNRATSSRVVLFVDFERPLSTPARLLNNLALGLLARTPYVTDPKARLERLDGTAN